jgi:hypothetical protein
MRGREIAIERGRDSSKIAQIGGAAGTAARRRMRQYLSGDGRSSANDWSLKWNWWS